MPQRGRVPIARRAAREDVRVRFLPPPSNVGVTPDLLSKMNNCTCLDSGPCAREEGIVAAAGATVMCVRKIVVPRHQSALPYPYPSEPIETEEGLPGHFR